MVKFCLNSPEKKRLLPPVTNLSRRAVRGVGPVVELSVKLTRVKVQNKLFQFARDTENTETHVGHQPSFIQFEVCTVVPKKQTKKIPNTAETNPTYLGGLLP